MRELLCAGCAQGDRHLREGYFTIFEATRVEPAERARVVAGRAKEPTASQRTIHVTANGQTTAHALDRGFYNCDRCHGEIRPRDRVWACTVWIPARQPEPAPWEDEYLEREG